MVVVLQGCQVVVLIAGQRTAIPENKACDDNGDPALVSWELLPHAVDVLG